MLPIPEYLALRQRPAQRCVMRQNWRDLTYLHCRCEVDALKGLLPQELEVDAFDGSAWIGLVAFKVRDVRPPWGPSIPWISSFPETNVRTYVHQRGEKPGIWFFSLDAARWLACQFARLAFGLPYFHASMSVDYENGSISYQSRRREAESYLIVQPGADLPAAEPGTLEFFLIERYLLYSCLRGKLVTGQVHHRPYPLRALSVDSCSETLLCSQNIPKSLWDHCCYSSGVT
jgi:uncharacterized protein YqjF (DUF2071 family)